MTPDETHKREIALKILEITRADFRQRVELKQQVVIVYAGAIAAILGFVLQNCSRNPAFLNILWVVPLLDLICARRDRSEIRRLNGKVAAPRPRFDVSEA